MRPRIAAATVAYGSALAHEGVSTSGLQVADAEGAGRPTDECLHGFAIIEADSLDEAVALVSKTPCAVAQGVVEVA